MFSSLSFKKRGNKTLQNEVQDRIAFGIVHKCIRIQSKWASYLQHKTERLSITGKSLGLVVFCALFGGFSLYLIANSIEGRNKEVFSIAHIKVPKSIDRANEQKTSAAIILTKEAVQKIEQFQLYMNTLDQTTGGKRKRDSMLLSRPGLMDTIRSIQKLYESQILNK